jgi:hypothetical protein
LFDLRNYNEVKAKVYEYMNKWIFIFDNLI